MKSNDLNINIHAWINMYIIWSSKIPPVDKNHLINRKRQWLDNSFKYQTNIHSNKFLSPIHPNVNSYLLSIVDELIKKYNINGIHLDYIRFKDNHYGNNKFGQNYFSIDKNNKNWDKFKIDRVSNLVKNISILIKNKKNNIIFSAAVKPNLLEAKNRFSQEWGSWLKNNIIDLVFPMNYYNEIDLFNRDLNLMRKRIPERLHEKIIIGIGCYNQSNEDVIDKMVLVQLRNMGGVSFFSYDNHKKDLNWFKPIKKKLFTN